ncbi:MAG: HEAT repeat domain-containing protein, partial [Cyclobacteriaceae bacterium]
QPDALVYWTEGGLYPKPNDNNHRDKLVRTGELMPVVSKYSRVSPSGIGRYRNTVLGDTFKDNLFSAQFNTHRIIRHKLIREGASFRTEDETFFSVDNVDFHPTDVMEDADGSLLVVETGGWFIKGCPLSQVSKPELKGGIYRVRREGAAKTADPYGNNIKWTSLSMQLAAKYVEDPRPFVRDRAVQWLVDHNAVAELTDLLHNSSSADTRTKVVFALYRIGTSDAMITMRNGLDDPDFQVRVAAARAAGLAKDGNAVNKLIELIRNDQPAVRRQAATALGQIGDKKAIAMLVAASESADDRFIQHAIINSLVMLNQPAPVLQAMENAAPGARQVALIALDQMPSSPLRASHLIPFLESENATLKRTALWVASHHPEWSADMLNFLRKRFQDVTPLTDEEKEMFGEILVAFCGDAAIQKFMADQMLGKSKEKTFLLKAMGECAQKEIPQVWITEVKRILVSENDPDIQTGALELIRLRGIKPLTDPLRQFANNKNNPVLLRMKALAALLDSLPQLTDLHFAWLIKQLNMRNEVSVRMEAASVLAHGHLTEEQLLQLATQYLPKADAFMLPRLVPVFKGEYSSKIGNALVTTLMNSSSLDSYTKENLLAVFQKYPADIKPVVDQLMTKLKNAHAERLEHIETLESGIGNGILENGRTLFFGKAACWTCHTIGPEGGSLGPDLTSIQKDRSTHDLLEAIVYPGLSLVREYETYRIKTIQADYSGIIQAQTSSHIVLGTAPQTSVRIPRNEIESMEILDVSLMPQGLDKLLTNQEMADLMAFIVGQDQNPKTDEEILR